MMAVPDENAIAARMAAGMSASRRRVLFCSELLILIDSLFASDVLFISIISASARASYSEAN
jgi:hypothetical protein